MYFKQNFKFLNGKWKQYDFHNNKLIFKGDLLNNKKGQKMNMIIIQI